MSELTNLFEDGWIKKNKTNSLKKEFNAVVKNQVKKNPKSICEILKSIKKSFFKLSNIITNKNKIEMAPAYTIIKTSAKNSTDDKNNIIEKWIIINIKRRSKNIGDEKANK